MGMLAIIPARGGSKRIPRKNIKPFCGKPIISYSIEIAHQCKCFDEIMVSTDDEEIAKIAGQYGAKVPFMRSPENSNDHAGLFEVFKEVYDEYSKRGRKFTTLCSLLPTVPFIRTDRILSGGDLLDKGKFDSVLAVTRFSYPIWRALERNDNNTSVRMIWPENYPKRSQDFSPVYHDAGRFYWINPERCFPKGRLYTDNTGSIEIPESEVQDIDTIEDWNIAEFKYEYLFSQTSPSSRHGPRMRTNKQHLK